MADRAAHRASMPQASTSTPPRPSLSSSHAKYRHSDDTLSPARHGRLGAKPVAPSWHPHAPQELKVKEPSSAVLLPELLPGANGSGRVDDAAAASPVSPISPLEPQQIKAEEVIDSQNVKLQRPSIKVRIITWNQGNSVPKGDLGVLLGRVGEYIAPEKDWDVSSDDDEEAEGRRERRASRPTSPTSSPQMGPSQSSTSRARQRTRGMGVAGQEHVPRKDRIPPLPHDDAHPYHVVVVAGQECPWGDGKRFSTGMGLAGELGDLGRSKSRAAHLAKEREKKETGGEKGKREERDKGATEPKDEEAKQKAANGTDKTKEKDEKNVEVSKGVKEGGEYPFNEAASPAQVTTPGAVAATLGRSGKGWSEMCEDWFCRGPLAQATATKGISLATASQTRSKSLGPLTPTADGVSTPFSSRPTTPLQNMVVPTGAPQSADVPSTSSPPKRVTLAVPRHMIRGLSRQRLDLEQRRQPTTVDGGDESPLLVGSQDDVHSIISPSEMTPSTSTQNLNSTEGSKKVHAQHQNHRLALRIPGLSGSHQVTVQSDGTPLSLGAYELVIKERCYMMYTAVYVWRGCLDRVRGVSSGTVKSGLLSGRLGNKGAVGISLHLGQTRLLFVNAHLAAHEGRIAERIANIEKIKRELKVDTFLPADDPRNEEDDLTASFDYAFWFGDLNFRVDISRRHADWLMMKKQYDHALAFDQLRKLMKESPEILNNFLEAPITFPPTFKYDVLKTLKAKKRDVKARLGTNMDDLSKGLIEMPSSLPALTSSAQGDVSMANSDEEDSDSASSRGHAPESSAGNASDFDGSESVAYSQSSVSPAKSVQSQKTNVVASNTAAAEGMNMHGKAIRVRKRLFKIISSAVDTVAPRQPSSGRAQASASGSYGSSAASQVRSGSANSFNSTDSGANRRRAASGSISENELKASSTHDSFASSYMPDRRGSVATSTGSNEVDSVGGHGGNADAIKSTENAEEIEAQKFDTSAKQRVPSWCDRVLWRSNVAAAEDDEDVADRAYEATAPRTRLGIALSHAFNRFQSKADNLQHQGAGSRLSLRTHLLAHPLGGGSGEAGSLSPNTLHSRRPSSPPTQVHPRRSFRPRRRDPSGNIKRSLTMIDSQGEDVTETEAIDTRKLPARTMTTFEMSLEPSKTTDTSLDRLDASLESAPAQLIQRSTSTSSASKFRRRRSLLGEKPSRKSGSSPMDLESPSPRSSINPERNIRANLAHVRHKPQRSASAVLQLNSKGPASSKEDFTSATSPTFRGAESHRRQSSPLRGERASSMQMSTASPHNRTSTNGAVTASSGGSGETPMPAKVSWWADRLGLSGLTPLMPLNLSNALRSSVGSESTLTQSQSAIASAAEAAQLIGPKRGVVECLLYKSLNDREMRMLEGRSDHRPVVFVGSIGIGDVHSTSRKPT